MKADARIQSAVCTIRERGIFGNIELLQILKVFAGYKYAARLIFASRKKADAALDCLQAAGLFAESEPISGYVGRADRNKGGWANLSSGSKRAVEYLLYIARSRDAAQSAKCTEAAGDDDAFGRLLSYPECCRRFFDDNFPAAEKIQGDLLPVVFDRSCVREEPFSYLLNVLWYFDAGYTEYWPCSLHCQAALADAMIGKMLLETYLPEIAGSMDSMLRHPVLYSEYSGIFVLVDARWDPSEAVLHYSAGKVKFTAETRLYRMLMKGDRLRRLGNGHWRIDRGQTAGKTLRHKNLRVGIFDDCGEPEISPVALKLAVLRAMNLPLPGTTAVEAAMLLTGHKSAMRLIVPAKRLHDVEYLAGAFGLQCFISPRRAVVIGEPATGDQYVEYRRTEDADAGCLVGLSLRTLTAKRCAELEAAPSDASKIELNTLLNYPDCCVKSFLSRVPHEDWVRPFLRNTPILSRYPCWTNRLGYLFSGKMLLYDYEPCSATCAESIRLGHTIREVLLRNGLEWLLEEYLRDVLTPIFLVDGVLVKMNGCKVKSGAGGIELSYHPADFELKDYALVPQAEHSAFWDSTGMRICGKQLTLYRNGREIAQLEQTQYNHRIFIFEE